MFIKYLLLNKSSMSSADSNLLLDISDINLSFNIY
jgi:hypothetical protein